VPVLGAEHDGGVPGGDWLGHEFWFGQNVIGNDLSGGPVTCFWGTLRGHPELCPPGS